MHRIFSGDGWLVFPDILKSARDHRPSPRLVQQPPVLIILCILYIDVQLIVLLDGSAQSRGAGARLAGKRESAQRGQAGFQRSGYPPPHHRDDTPGSASRPAVPSVNRFISKQRILIDLYSSCGGFRDPQKIMLSSAEARELRRRAAVAVLSGAACKDDSPLPNLSNDEIAGRLDTRREVVSMSQAVL